MVNLGNPELAFQTALMPCDGVGLARMEFIINEHIKVHPMAVLHPERIVDPAVRAQVQALWAGCRTAPATSSSAWPKAWAPSPPPSTRGR
jgi:phosphoenolpyruvate synthase/pyruvate phosphate dikinase